MKSTFVSIGLIAASTAVAPPASAGLLLMFSDDGSGGTVVTARGSGVATPDAIIGNPASQISSFQNVGDYTKQNFPADPSSQPNPALTSPIALRPGVSIASLLFDDDTNFELSLDDMSVNLSAPLVAGQTYSAMGSSAIAGVPISALNSGVYTSEFALGLIDELTMVVRDAGGNVPIVACSGNCVTGPTLGVGSFGGGGGALVIADGGVVSAPGGGAIGFNGPDTGTVDVLGAGAHLDLGGGTSSLVLVGNRGGTGTLTISEDGLVTINSTPSFEAGLSAGIGGVGNVLIDSGGQLVLRDVAGASGLGGVLVGLNDDTGRIGNGTVTVTGAGSAIRLEGQGEGTLGITVGGSSNVLGAGIARGELNVLDGARVTVDSPSEESLLVLGHGSRSAGFVRVSGAGSEISLTGPRSGLYVASDNLSTLDENTNVGRLEIANSGRVLVGSTNGSAIALIGHGTGTGLVEVNTGGRLDVEGDIRVSANNDVANDYQRGTGNAQQTGTLAIDGTGVVSATGTVYVGNGTSPTLNGFLLGTGTLIGNTVVQTGGLLAPGTSPGTFTIDGDLTLAGGWLEIEMAGLAAGLHDLLRVTGVADMTAANIMFSFLDGFLPTAGTSFEFLRADTILGLSSASFSYRGAPDGFLFDIVQDGGALRFGARSPVSVPEPSGLALLLTGLIAVAGWRRRRSAAEASF